MTNKIKIAIISLVLIFGFTISLQAGEWHTYHQENDQKTRGPYLGFGFFLPDSPLISGHLIIKNRDKLNLTTGQSGQLDQIILKIKESMSKNRAKLKIAELELVNILKQGTPSRKKIGKKVKTLGNLRTSIALEFMEFLFQINNILTPEQKEKMKKIK